MNKFLKQFLYMPLAFLVLGILSSCGGGGGGSSVVAPTMTVTTAVTTAVTTSVTPPPMTVTTAVTTSVTPPRMTATTAITSAISDYTVNLQAANAITGNFDPLNPSFSGNHGLAQIGADEAYQRGYFGQGVTVGVVDSGVLTTHVALTANLVPGRRVDSSGNLYTDINDASGHGTFIAGVIGGAINDTLFQGVAPSASIMPLQFGNTSDGGLDGNPLALFNYAATSGVHILNNNRPLNVVTGTFDATGFRSINNDSIAHYRFNVEARVPLFKPLFAHYGDAFINEFSHIATTIGAADIVFVLPAGDEGWHEGGSVRMTIRDDVFYGLYNGYAFDVSQYDFLINFFQYDDEQTVILNTLAFDVNDPGGYALAPIYEESLLGRWTHVVAVNSVNAIADFSNGCGKDTKYWCLAAPGVDITGLVHDSDTAVTVDSGTAIAAAYVSGALAVLKSRLPDMPMSVILALLFTTATDLSVGDEDDGVDDVYGHGLVNLSAAINLQGSINLVVLNFPVSDREVGYKITLSPPNSATIYVRTAEFTINYALSLIGADKAYERGYFGQGVTVGVVDTGVRTSHIDLTANIVAGRRSDRDGNLYTDINDAHGHGTFVAGVIGGVSNGTLFQGVAPQASIMPLQRGSTTDGGLVGDWGALFGYAATSGVHILNNSWGPGGVRVSGTYVGGYRDSTIDITVNIAMTLPKIKFFLDNDGGLLDNFSEIVATIGSADMIFVWSAGNRGWNDDSYSYYIDGRPFRTSDIVNGFTEYYKGETFVYGTLDIDPNSPGGYALAPIYEPSLRGRWVHVPAVNRHSSIIQLSNGCGRESKYWCLVAPGEGISNIYGNSDTSVLLHWTGTSFSAPHVSGALAVLKSRLPDMPMSVVLALLFYTATDLGEVGIDDVYGHGLVNLERAVTLQGSINLVVPNLTTTYLLLGDEQPTVAVGSNDLGVASAANNLLQSKSKVSPLLAALKEQLREVSAAVEFLPGYYYNTPLGALIEVSETDSNLSNLSNLGKAASAMLSQTQSREMGYGLSVLENKGTLLEVSHETEFGRLNYDICSHCETSLWEEEQTTEIATPFFASNRPQMSYAAKLGSGDVEIFAATGIEDTTTSNDYQQYGIRLNVPTSESGNENRLESGNAKSGFLEFSRTTEEDTLYGGEYSGAFALSGSETYQGRLHTERSFTDNWRGMADYQFGWTNSEAQGGGLITDISRLRFDGYRIGVEGSSLFGVPFAGDGLMRFGITRQSGIRSGTIRLRYGVATTSEFIEDYQYALNNGYEVVEREFSLATKPTTLYHWGYTFAPRAQMQAAFGLEYKAAANDNDSAAAASLVLNWSY